MTTAIHLRTVDAPATLREKTRLPRPLASGLMLAVSVSALTVFAAGSALAQSGAAAPNTSTSGGPGPSLSQMQPVPAGLTGAAWNVANQAYTAYNQKNYRRAIELVREALRLRPDVPQLWLLLMDALDADGKLAESVAAGNEALAAGVKDPALSARLRAASSMLAQGPSLAANKALRAHDPKAAIIAARKAIALVPDDLSYHMLLVYSLIADGQIDAAEKAANAAVEVDPQSFLPKVLRGYLRERLGRLDQADADFDAALKDEVLTGETERDVRIIIADAALAAGKPQRALDILAALGKTSDPGVAIRTEVAEAQLRDPSLRDQKAYMDLPVPFQKCTDTPYGPVCTLVPAATPPGRGATDVPGFVTAQAAFVAFREGDDAKAEKLIREALKLNPGNAAWHRMLIETLARAGKTKELEVAINDTLAKLGDDPALRALRANTDKRLAEPWALEALKRLAEPWATQALKEIDHKKAAEAVTLARKAVDRSPATMTYRVILIYALMAAQQTEEAQSAAEAALKEDENDPLVRVLYAYLLQKNGKHAEAMQEFETLLGSDILTESEDINYRLIAANAALANGDAEGALKLLKPLDDKKNEVVKDYRERAERFARAPASKRPEMAPPSVLCQPTKYGIICSVFFGPSGSGMNAAAPGYAAATAAYKALARRDYATAVAQARKALAAAPGNMNYRRLLLDALIGARRYDEAEQILSQLLARSPRDAALLVQRGTLRLQARQFAGAIRDFRAALSTGHLSGAQARTVRLSLADAALQAKDPELAISVLGPLRGEASYAVQSRLGYAYLALGDKAQALASFEAAAHAARSRQERNAMLSARVSTLVELGRKDEARALFRTAYDRGDLRGMRTVDLAVLASQAGEDELAYEYFTQANDQWQLRGTNLINAAYNAKRTFHNEQAVDYFKSAIDAHREGKLPMEPQYLFGLRREVAELTRTWGAYASVSYGAVGVAPGSYLVAPNNPTGQHTLGVGGEIYWRPPGIGYRDGALVEVFARGFMTAYAENGGDTGWNTFQPSVGIRWKPLKSENLVLEASYLFPLSSVTRSDFLLRAAYSKSEGTDLRVDVPNWVAWQIYGDFNYYTNLPETIATFELRYGHAFRLDDISDRLVLWPYLALGGGYDNGYATPFALGVGPGATLRYWFNEDEYTAPRSYVDLTAQYRFKLSGDDRAEGLFAGAFLSY